VCGRSLTTASWCCQVYHAHRAWHVMVLRPVPPVCGRRCICAVLYTHHGPPEPPRVYSRGTGVSLVLAYPQCVSTTVMQVGTSTVGGQAAALQVEQLEQRQEAAAQEMQASLQLLRGAVTHTAEQVRALGHPAPFGCCCCCWDGLLLLTLHPQHTQDQLLGCSQAHRCCTAVDSW
jgi:hypothetical protein